MDDKRQRKIIEEYLKVSEQDIEKTMGRILLSGQGVDVASVEEEKIEKSLRDYLDDKISVFRQKICVEWKFQEKIKNSRLANNIELIAAIADLISPYVGIPPAALVATLLFKKGLDKLCQAER